MNLFSGSVSAQCIKALFGFRWGIVSLVMLSTVPTALVGAVTTTYTWTGTGSDSDLYTIENWLDEVPLPNAAWNRDADITGIILRFGNSRRTYVEYDDIYANQVIFENFTQPYHLNSVGGGTLHVGSGGIDYNPTQDLWTRIEDNVALHASQTWHIANGTLQLDGSINDLIASEPQIEGDYQVEKTGAGTLQLSGGYYSDWAGGLKLTQGTVVIGASEDSHATMLGTGPLTFNGGKLGVQKSRYNDEVTIANNIISNGTVLIKSEGAVVLGEEASTLVLDADTTLNFSGGPYSIAHTITDQGNNHSLTVDSIAAIVHYGVSDWTGGTYINKGVFIFGSEDNTPGQAASIYIATDGYAGVGAANSVETFLSEVALPDSSGTIGFDSDPKSETGPDTFYANINLTGAHNDLRLGSATQAILGDSYNPPTGYEQITPQGNSYNFGGGGGTLFVASLLTDGPASREVRVESIDALPLTVWLLNPHNDFSGDVTVDNSALIFGPGVVPDNVNSFSVSSTGYVGTAETEISAGGWLSYFPANTSGTIGFDVSHSASVGWEIADLDTSAFETAAVGSATSVRDTSGEFSAPGLTLTGTLTPNSDGSHRFVAYKGGAVAVSGTLTGNSLLIGGPFSIATFGDRLSEEYSTVMISGDNAGHLAYGTTLYSGRLLVGQSNGLIGDDATSALGSGYLYAAPVLFTEEGEDDAPSPQLAVTNTGIIIPNNIYITAAELGLGGAHNFELSGNISGSGELYVGEDSEGSFELTLSGANSFSGGVYLSNNASLKVNSNTGTGTGALGFGNSGGNVTFTSLNPVVHGFARNDGSYNYINLDHEGNQTLTINQQDAGTFKGSIYGSDATIIKSGSGSLRLEGGNIFTNGIADGQGHQVGIEITEGTLIFSNGASLYDNNEYRTPAVKVSGGSMALAGGTTFSNPVIVGSGGKLAGFGTYTQNVSIGNGAILSPGLADNGATGSMQFYHLELDGGGIYEYNLQSPDFNDITGHDVITVNNPGSQNQTLVINADAAHPFIIKVVSLDSSGNAGTLEGIDEGHGLYSWTLINFDVLSIPGNSDLFDPTLFSLDLTGFSSDALNGGEFSLFQQDNQIMLGFTPVPEPSTYAMLALGLGITCWTLRRRNRR
jgi:hypothetical protein